MRVLLFKGVGKRILQRAVNHFNAEEKKEGAADV